MNHQLKNILPLLSILIIFALQGCSSNTLTQTDAAEHKQDNSKVQSLVNTNANTENNTIQDAKFILKETGYLYSNIRYGISSVSSTETSDLSEKEPGETGDDTKSSSEIIVNSWEDAKAYLSNDKIQLLNNAFLNSGMKNISIIISDDADSTHNASAVYSFDNSNVDISLITDFASADGNEFEYGHYYPSELYDENIIHTGYSWQCFSYKDYEGIEHKSAVYAQNDLICEVTFDNCEEDFIQKVLKNINPMAADQSE